MTLTKKFLKAWAFEKNDAARTDIQHRIDGGVKIERTAFWVSVGAHSFRCDSPARAVKFAAALNTLRRPLHLIKQDLDEDWAARVKERDNQTCVGCCVQGPKMKFAAITGKDSLTAHHWLKTKSRAGMARWARPCGVTYHFAEHIHTLHENPCWADMKPILEYVTLTEGEEAVDATLALTSVPATEAAVRALWLERCGKKEVAP